MIYIKLGNDMFTYGNTYGIRYNGKYAHAQAGTFKTCLGTRHHVPSNSLTAQALCFVCERAFEYLMHKGLWRRRRRRGGASRSLRSFPLLVEYVDTFIEQIIQKFMCVLMHCVIEKLCKIR